MPIHNMFVDPVTYGLGSKHELVECKIYKICSVDGKHEATLSDFSTVVENYHLLANEIETLRGLITLPDGTVCGRLKDIWPGKDAEGLHMKYLVVPIPENERSGVEELLKECNQEHYKQIKFWE